MMFDMQRTILEGAFLSALFSVLILAILYYNPRLLLNDYPKEIQDAVPPKTVKEKYQSNISSLFVILILLFIPFLFTLRYDNETSFWAISLYFFIVFMIVNLVDLFLLDWIIFCKITPKFIVIPGTEGMGIYKDFIFHLKASLKGSIICAIFSLLLAGLRVLVKTG
ncbi:nitroreductase [Bacillus manliponensis]|uniref:nitroreductase n=1 Tax=Bacillus manliponensis TaxID=574376 RepID=UPI003516C81F